VYQFLVRSIGSVDTWSFLDHFASDHVEVRYEVVVRVELSTDWGDENTIELRLLWFSAKAHDAKARDYAWPHRRSDGLVSISAMLRCAL
jgi:hypothetical protein